MKMRRLGRLSLLVGLIVAAVPALAEGLNEAEVRAVASAYATAKMVGFMQAYCVNRYPDSGPDSRQALDAWQQKHDVPALEAWLSVRTGQGTLASLDSSDSAEQLHEKLDAQPQQAQIICRSFGTLLQGNDYDLRGLYPAAYQVLGQPDPGRELQAPGPAKPSGTLYTVAQLNALLEQWRKQDYRTLDTRAQNLGRVYVQGTVVPRGEHEFLETHRDGFQSKASVSCMRDLSAHVGRELTVIGRIDDPGSLIFMKDCEIVDDASGLSPAAIAERGGMRRSTVDSTRVMAAPNQGLKLGQITGLLHHGKGVYQTTGYQFEENTYLLLQDGTLYDNLQFPPADLDVAASRQLEPNHWHRWKRNGAEVLVRWSDENGNPAGDWEPLPGKLITPSDLPRRLGGRFSTASAYNYGMSVSTFRSSYTFDEKGRFSYSGSSLMSGGMALPDNGTGVSGTATAGSAAASFTPTGTFASASGGSSEQGSYSIDGYTLEMRSENGQVRRAYFFADPDGRSVMIDGTTYSVLSD